MTVTPGAATINPVNRLGVSVPANLGSKGGSVTPVSWNTMALMLMDVCVSKKGHLEMLMLTHTRNVLFMKHFSM